MLIYPPSNAVPKGKMMISHLKHSSDPGRFAGNKITFSRMIGLPLSKAEKMTNEARHSFHASQRTRRAQILFAIV